MRVLGILVNLLGWMIAVGGLFVTSSNGGRLLFALVGIGVSLFGIFGLINKYYLSRAIWKN